MEIVEYAAMAVGVSAFLISAVPPLIPIFAHGTAILLFLNGTALLANMTSSDPDPLLVVSAFEWAIIVAFVCPKSMRNPTDPPDH